MSSRTRSESEQPDKTVLRAEARARRASLDAADRSEWSAAVVAELTALLPSGGQVMTYMAMGDELDLTDLNTRLAAAGRLVLPRVEGRRLAAVPWNGADDLVVSRFGVLEPLGEGMAPSVLAAVVVPALAFDQAGHRIGYGAGFYDRFLPEVSPVCLVVGVCFSAQLVVEIGAEPHDVAIPVVVTEGGALPRPPEAPRRR